MRPAAIAATSARLIRRVARHVKLARTKAKAITAILICSTDGPATGNAPVVTRPTPGNGMMNWDGRMKTVIGQTDNGSTSARHKKAGKDRKMNRCTKEDNWVEKALFPERETREFIDLTPAMTQDETGLPFRYRVDEWLPETRGLKGRWRKGTCLYRDCENQKNKAIAHAIECRKEGITCRIYDEMEKKYLSHFLFIDLTPAMTPEEIESALSGSEGCQDLSDNFLTSARHKKAGKELNMRKFVPCRGGIDEHEHTVYCGCPSQGFGGWVDDSGLFCSCGCQDKIGIDPSIGGSQSQLDLTPAMTPEEIESALSGPEGDSKAVARAIEAAIAETPCPKDESSAMHLAAQVMGSKGGSRKSPAKTRANSANGKKGGWPKGRPRGTRTAGGETPSGVTWPREFTEKDLPF